MKIKVFTLCALVVVGSGCYHATIETGATPSTQVIEQPWSSGWIYGLVPPKTVEAAQRCPNGVAKIETQLSFPNQLVNVLTFGIYTPMSIKVTCAQGRAGDAATTLQAGIDPRAAIEVAAQLAAVIGTPVAVQF
jgi:hypothetical protein